MKFSLSPVQVAVNGGLEGTLVLLDGRLVAVLTKLDEKYDDHSGRWFLEAGFGPVDGLNHPTFADLDQAQQWIAERLLARAKQGL